MKRKFNLVVALLLAFSLMLVGVEEAYAFQTTNESYPVSQGVKYSNYTYSSKPINHLEVDLSNPYTELKLGLPNPINSLSTLTDRANKDSREGNRVVGAINANFYNMTGGYPLYLISQNNNIVMPEVLSDTKQYYVSEPIAFGVTSNGLVEIDYYDSNISVQYNNQSIELNGLNRTRESNEGILYTPQYLVSKTPTNQYGMEVIVETSQTIGATKFGQTLTGKVTAIRNYGDENRPTIPRNGFVLSFNGKAMEKFKNVKIGEQITASISIDAKWQDAKFIMASGPLLVYNGKVNVTMDTNSSRAKQVTPRSVIAISKDKTKAHLITVDKGINLAQFAAYLEKLGVDRAINLDGGGSTTMGIRKYGSNTVVLANSPSGGTQRKINAIIEAVSTGATGTATTMKVTRDQIGTLLVGATVTLKPSYVLDEHYNPLPINANDFTITSPKNLVTVNGLSYTAAKPGADTITVQNGNARQTIPVTVVDAPASLVISSTSKTIESGASMQFTAKAKDANGNNLIYVPSQLKWAVEGDIGTISSTGLFKSNGKTGKGKITATLGTKTVSTDIEISKKSVFSDISNSHPYKKEIEYLVNKGLISGYGDGTFRPNESLTRAHAAVLLSRALNLDVSKVTNPNFTDVPTSYVYYKQIAAIENAGIMSGVGNGKFNPSANLTRAQMAKILVEAFKLSGTSGITFKDVGKTHWAAEYIDTLATNKITTGYGDDTFKPNVEVSRAHFAVFLYRAITK